MSFNRAYYKPCPDCGKMFGRGKGKNGLAWHPCNTTEQIAREWRDKVYRDGWSAGAKLVVDSILAGISPSVWKSGVKA